MIITNADMLPMDLWSIGDPFAGLQPSGFFPAPQISTPMRTQITEPALSLGLPRLTAPDAPSLAETAAWASNNWMDSPYKAVLSTPALAPPIYGPPAPQASPSFLGAFTKPWETMAETIAKTAEFTFVEANKMLPGLMLEKLGLMPERQVVNSKGDVEYHVYQTPGMAGATVPGVKQEQPQGLFGIGYATGQPATVVPVSSPTTAAIGMTPLLILLAIFLFARK